jgi:cell wall-associated NlpC family hydrolase
MRDFLPRPGRQPVLALALALAAFSAPAFAAPRQADRADPISRFLAERALAPATAASAGNPLTSPAVLADRVRDRTTDMVLTAMNFLGVPYKRGGSSESAGFDCSGFTRHIFEMSLGLVLPRRVDQQASAPGLTPVPRDELQPGDLVFFNTLKRTFSHVGIYIGEGKFIHSPRPGGEVRVEEMGLAYWRKRFTGARRAEPVAEATSVAAVAPATPAASSAAH